MLLNHDPNQILGPVVEKSIDKDDRMGRAKARFDEDDLAQRSLSKVKSGSLRGVSVSYAATKAQRIEEDEEWQSPEGRTFKGPLVVATRWQPVELSLTPIPADSTVGVGRTVEPVQEDREVKISKALRAALEKRGLPTDATDAEALEFLNEHPDLVEPQEATRSDDNDEVAETVAALQTEIDGARDAVVVTQTELRRSADLFKIAEQGRMPEGTAKRWILDGTTTDQARDQALQHWHNTNPPVGQTQTVDVGEDALSKLNRYATAGICNRYGLPLDDDAPKDAPSYFSLRQYVTERCALHPELGTNARYMPYAQLIGSRAFFHSTSDFANLLENIGNKSLRRGYTEAPTTYQIWTARRDIENFQAQTSVNFGQAKVYQEKPELMPISEQTIADAKETYTLVTYGNRFSGSREMFINDDLGGFARIASLLGAAGARTINQVVYDHLTGAVTMTEDSKSLFADDHTSGDNLGTAGAPSDTTITEGRKLMRLQKGLGTGAPTLNIQPTYIINPAAHEHTVDQLLNGIYSPTTAATSQVSSIRSLQQVTEPYLDGKSTTAWYLAATPALVETIIVGRLAGQTAPVIARETDNNILGVAFVAYLDVVARAIDHRGLFKNAGA